MARTRKRSKAKDKARAERREFCEISRAVKVARSEKFAEYCRLVDAGALCPACGCPLVDWDGLVSVSVSVLTDRGIVHEACA